MQVRGSQPSAWDVGRGHLCLTRVELASSSGGAFLGRWRREPGSLEQVSNMLGPRPAPPPHTPPETPQQTPLPVARGSMG